jgi:hypothetical protein
MEIADIRDWSVVCDHARAIEAGHFVCVHCHQKVQPNEWWTHIGTNPFSDLPVDRRKLTVIHERCTARPTERNRAGYTSLRSFYERAAIRPGEYVRVIATSQVYRVMDIDVGPNGGLIYALDAGCKRPFFDPSRDQVIYAAGGEVEAAARPRSAQAR